jgi:hypothetical protein
MEENREAPEEMKKKMIRVYDLMDTIYDLKESVKDNQTEMEDLYSEIIEYMDTTGNTQFTTDDGVFELKKSIKYTKKKKVNRQAKHPQT